MTQPQRSRMSSRARRCSGSQRSSTTSPPAAEQDLLDELLENPLAMGGLGAVVLLVLMVGPAMLYSHYQAKAEGTK